MAERLIGLQEVCRRLKVSGPTFYLHLGEYLADGLVEARCVGSKERTFTESSVDALIREAGASGNKIGELHKYRRGRKKQEALV